MKGLILKLLIALGAVLWLYVIALAAGIVRGEEVQISWIEQRVYWMTLRDGAVDVCASQDFAWIEQTIEEGWGIEVKENCSEPDLTVDIHELPLWDGQVACGTAEWGDPCAVEINTWCIENRDWFEADGVPEIAVLHEFGHCAGFNHREDYGGVMYPLTQYRPNEEDIKVLYGRYGLTVGLVPEPRPGEWVMARWSGPPTTPETLGVKAVYILENGQWLRYIDGALEGVNTIGTIQPDQPLIAFGQD